MDRPDIINFSALESELKTAVEADKKYQRENDAKFRAIHQKVATYEEFRDIVLASHLKPLERKDIFDAQRKQPWNSFAKSRKQEKDDTPKIVHPLPSDFQPRTELDFTREWRKPGRSSQDKYGLLVRLGGETLQDVFKAEVSLGLLGEFLLILSQCFRPGDEVVVTGLLAGLSKTGRFGLHVSLLSQTEQEACKGLFHRLWDFVRASRLLQQNPSVDGEEDHEHSLLSEQCVAPLCEHRAETEKDELEEQLVHLMTLYGFWTFCPLLLIAYQAPDDKEDIFTTTACPAFLVFDSRVYLADITIELPCYCKPEDTISVVWYYQRHMGSQDTKALTDFNGTTTVDSSKVGRDSKLNSRFSIRLFSLVIFRARASDSGHYVCGSASGEFFYGYDVDVQVARKVSVSEGSPQGEDKPGQVFTKYLPWSPCDRCGIQGEQIRVGLCFVWNERLHVRYRQENSTVASCGSSAVPWTFRSSKANKGAELAVRSCIAICPPKPEIKQKQQPLMDFLNDGKPTSQNLPVYFHKHQADSGLVLSCPGAEARDVVAWDKGSIPLYRSQYGDDLNGKSGIFIDVGQQLNFRPVSLEDKGTYYCWIQGKKAAEIRLRVYLGLRRRRNFFDQEVFIALRDILISFGGLTFLASVLIFARFLWKFCKRSRA